CQHSHGAPLTF
nr:immunoglobulin light chain junction region [Macaca mulatta]MOW34485.1 immunoglobulin light chain junction region [Macaca mulatta]MOW35078.1 immunoglobulin light chain junction region [Macaca mulatta]MOW35776.1 immunoglobulin light chain junction region [Macaca mulatta]MOW35872.1 immunoglobulin light chain junction region [Macaca mulatta]